MLSDPDTIGSTALPHGTAVLDDPARNRGTAFTPDERRTLRIEGLLPTQVADLDVQMERVLGHLDAKPTDLERYVYLMGLSQRNETLFFALLMSDPARFVPIVDNPTLAEACRDYHCERRVERTPTAGSRSRMMIAYRHSSGSWPAHPPDARPADAELPRDRTRSNALGEKAANLLDVD